MSRVNVLNYNEKDGLMTKLILFAVTVLFSISTSQANDSIIISQVNDFVSASQVNDSVLSVSPISAFDAGLVAPNESDLVTEDAVLLVGIIDWLLAHCTNCGGWLS